MSNSTITSTPSSPSKDAKRSRSNPDTIANNKKQKMDRAPFSDPVSVVTFLVGPDPSPSKFIVHKDVVCRHSKVLETAFNGGFVEGQTQTYRLEDVSAAAFRLLMEWFYSRSLTLLQLDADYEPSEGNLTENAEDATLVMLWVLAARFGMPNLQNAVIDSMEKICVVTGSFPMLIFHYIYENTPTASNLRRYVVDICVCGGTQGLYLKNAKNYPHEMMVDIAEGQMQLWGSSRIREVEVSNYYVDANLD